MESHTHRRISPRTGRYGFVVIQTDKIRDFSDKYLLLGDHRIDMERRMTGEYAEQGLSYTRKLTHTKKIP